MKKFNKTLLAVNMLLLSASNSFAATGETTTGTSSIKFLAIGVAAIIIVLLLFLGYRIDSKDNRRGAEKRRKEAKQKAREEKYEADKISYQKDEVSMSDINEVTEYEEDDEDEDIEVEEYEDNEDEEDVEYGEEFDTSIIDDIEDDIPEVEEKETVVDPLMDELRKIQENKPEVKETPLIATEEPEEVVVEVEAKEPETTKKDNFEEMDFLAQMEENLKKNQEKRNSKTTKKKKEE